MVITLFQLGFKNAFSFHLETENVAIFSNLIYYFFAGKFSEMRIVSRCYCLN